MLIIISTAYLGFSINKQSTSEMEEEIGDSLAGFAYQMSDKLDRYMWSWKGEINRLSKIDSFTETGEEANAQLLQEVASRLRLHIEVNAFLCWQGGDEFVMLMPALEGRNADTAKSKAEEIIKSLNESFQIEGHSVQIGCSIGGAIWPDHAGDILTMVKLADEALDASENNGKNRVIFYNEIQYPL
ncbi:diguanylate cyclase domain-containing protein [Paenibacillus sinopodophylli]|uniref:diguanylate cyclase domain-containing protein n=1 Tax=Paenibacillus sinopodophylli TaxID=1837342 RepID=UPI00110D21FB|nr:GGDEF domain-containing protein [Paenibacillus sinopodophylli]